MDVKSRIGYRTIVILGATIGSVFWLLFAVDQYPWVVPADSDFSIEKQRGQFQFIVSNWIYPRFLPEGDTGTPGWRMKKPRTPRG